MPRRQVLPSDPMVSAVGVTPNDATDLAATTRGLYIGGAGNVQVTMAGYEVGGGQTVILNALAVGVIHRIQVTRIWNTNTTATNIVALW